MHSFSSFEFSLFLTDLLQAVNRKEKYRRKYSAKRHILGNYIEGRSVIAGDRRERGNLRFLSLRAQSGSPIERNFIITGLEISFLRDCRSSSQ